MPQILQTPPFTNPSTTTVDVLVDRVARFFGGAADEETRQLAIDSLDRAADYMNGASVWLFRLLEQEYPDTDLGGAFTDGQTSLTLPTDFGWPDVRFYCYDSDDLLLTTGSWVNWQNYRERSGDLSPSSSKYGVPSIMSIKNENEATAYLWSPIDTSEVSKIKLIYLARLLRITDASDGTLYAAKEAQEAMTHGGVAYAMQFRHSTKPNIWEPYFQRFEKAIAVARSASHRREESYIGWAEPLVSPLPLRGHYPAIIRVE